MLLPGLFVALAKCSRTVLGSICDTSDEHWVGILSRCLQQATEEQEHGLYRTKVPSLIGAAGITLSASVEASILSKLQNVADLSKSFGFVGV